jgi:hypothetical protein
MGLFSKNASLTAEALREASGLSRSPFDVGNLLEDEIRETLSHPRDLDELPPEEWGPRRHFPDLVANSPRTPSGLTADGFVPTRDEFDLGKITSEAIKADREATAAAIEQLGQDIEDRMRRLETEIKIESQRQLAEIKELAEQHREAGKLHAAKVESAAADLIESRNLIEAMRKKMGS